MFRNVFVPENESVEQVEDKVRKFMGTMGLPSLANELDKSHRLGPTKNINGKNHQDIIVRFKSHSARYAVYNKRKSLPNIRISPNLTKKRGKLLSNAVELTENIQTNDWGFVFANSHGDLLVRLKDKYEGKHYHSFNSIECLADKLKQIGLLDQ